MTLPGKIPVNILYDEDVLVLRIKTLNDYRPFKREKCWSFLFIRKATLKNFKKMINYGLHITTEK
jgi:hypothetical protein